jgi:L-fucose isomerase
MDVAEAFLNDPYDWEGPHEPIVAATEADIDGALTIEILKHISGEPVLFADVRH